MPTHIPEPPGAPPGRPGGAGRPHPKMERYPRSGPPRPALFGGLFPPTEPRGRPPAALDVTAPPGYGETQFVYIAQLCLLAPEPRPGYQAALRQAAERYLLRTGCSDELVGLCREALELRISSAETAPPAPSRRAGADRASEFERRLDAYESTEPFPIRVLEAIWGNLRGAGRPAAEARALPLEPDGRRPGTDAPALSAAIAALPDQGARSECVARFESLAQQVWGWEYPRLPEGARARILEDFRALAEARGAPEAGAPNVTIRLLWHFERAGVPYSLRMFRLPEGNDSWQKNLARLGALGTWDPRHPAPPRAPAPPAGAAPPAAAPPGKGAPAPRGAAPPPPTKWPG